jgi:hypothetical protein
VTPVERLATALLNGDGALPDADDDGALEDTQEWYARPGDLAAQTLAADPTIAADLDFGAAWRRVEAALPDQYQGEIGFELIVTGGPLLAEGLRLLREYLDMIEHELEVEKKP